ncbi:MAG: HAD family hydrolase [Candidatus Buchananbacteria bacterium]|nr:HAD family hydrolase [Candidatus Buchananbacteria bacterium]
MSNINDQLKPPSSIKVIVFDFDNCLVLDEKTKTGSEEIKDQAWFEIFSEYDRKELEAVLDQAKKIVVGGAGDRNDIAQQILRHFNHPEATLAASAIKKCDLFNQYVQKRIGEVIITPATRKTLSELASQYPLYINTATPRDAALESLKILNLISFFKEVFGRPGTKVDNLQKIIAAESVNPMQVLFIDDQPGGWDAAQTVGCIFAGIYTAKNKLWQNEKQPFPLVNSLTELPALLLKINY